jgi:hypothetical protein
VFEAGEREAPTRSGPLFTRRKATAPKRLKANSRSLQRLMLLPLGAESDLITRIPYASPTGLRSRTRKRPPLRARRRRIGVASPIAEMPPGRNPRYRKSNSELLAGSYLGKNGRFFDDADVVQLLREAVDREGSISAFAKRAGLHRVAVNNILNGRRPVSQRLAKALGLRKVYVAE